ncbi:glycosyltransferase [Oryzicola mucosus]|uniref:Glycosyltransferase subfamily 4-like N-terminal domain-containing protein n=1 Tax=Oryzicola mucosus TaxID=2767425 RepID=A0A8J6TWF2_9HYPH|nr:hypothetical protein [Oryzicola mucosus]MBD0413471.1 hypothetical protein [Oryzicola mucosus]
MKKKPNVLMFAPSFAPNFFSEALVNSKLALAMLDEGWEVTVFSASAVSDFGYTDTWESPWQPLRPIVRQIPAAGNHGSLKKIGRAAWAIATGRHPVPGAIWAAKVARAALEIHAVRPFDLMLTRSTSCIAHLPGLIVKRAAGVPWIANWNDPPPHLFPAPYNYPISPLRRFFTERYLSEAAAVADLNTFPSERLMRYLAEPLLISDPKRMHVVPHIGLGFRGHAPTGKKDRFRISHAGNLSVERNPRGFLRALAEVANRHTEIRFELELIGKIDDGIKAEVEKLQLSKVVTFLPNLSFQACFQQMEESDALLLIEASVENGIFFPSKIVDYCEVGRPILFISPEQGVSREMNDRFKLGYFCNVDEPTSIVVGLEKLVLDWKADRISYSGLEDMRTIVSPSEIVGQIGRLARSLGVH